MRIRKPIYKILAGAIILSFLSVTAAPALDICEGSCCNNNGKMIHQDSMISPSHFPMETGVDHMLKMPQMAHGSQPVVNANSKVPGCHGEGMSSCCEMEQAPEPEKIQGLITSLDRSDRYLPVALASVIWENSLNDRQSYLSIIMYPLKARAAPIPLYLQNDSFLF
ncbi:MAG: hypothetical protein JRC68_05700 [Deltaproteobacteria bacterium]|nr:hypothetical protein [Deltaproteobacteria bacterium]